MSPRPTIPLLLRQPSHHAPSVTLSARSLSYHRLTTTTSISPHFHKPPRPLQTSPRPHPRQQLLIHHHQHRTYWAHRPTEDAHDITRKDELKTKEILHTGGHKNEVVPKPLTRPLGLEHPPLPGQNSGRDERTWSDVWDDFFDPQVAVRNRRRVIWEAFHNNFYKDIFNIGKKYWGKSIISPSTPYRAHLALYFPNLQGKTLSKPPQFTDTTPALRGKITLISIMGSDMAREQAASFASPAANPELHEFVAAYNAKKGGEVVQLAHVNNEENVLRAALVRAYFYRQRRLYPRNEWARYWLNTRGLSMEIRDCLGMWNHKVGYLYLLDGECRIRWAGNGPAWEEEKKGLVNCVRRLCEERERGKVVGGKGAVVRKMGSVGNLQEGLEGKTGRGKMMEDKFRRRTSVASS